MSRINKDKNLKSYFAPIRWRSLESTENSKSSYSFYKQKVSA